MAFSILKCNYVLHLHTITKFLDGGIKLFFFLYMVTFYLDVMNNFGNEQ